MSSPKPTVFYHAVDGSTLLGILKTFLPYSLPLIRRLQFHHKSPQARVLATFPTDATPDSAPQCFCAAFIDRSRRPDTEAWFFVSGSIEGRCPQTEERLCPGCSSATLAVIAQAATLPYQESDQKGLPETAAASQRKGEDTFTDYTKVTSEDYSLHLSNPSIFLIGSLAQLPVDILLAHDLIRKDLPGLQLPYQKFIFRTSDLPSANAVLPDGLSWGHVRREDFALAKSRTAIKRSDRTLALLPSIAIIPSSSNTHNVNAAAAPIAWAFIGVDGSLSSLHVEPEYRGKGLAKALTTKLFREELATFDKSEGNEVGGWWAHSDVALENRKSSGVARGLGGKEGWVVNWVRVDLDKLPNINQP